MWWEVVVGVGVIKMALQFTCHLVARIPSASACGAVYADTATQTAFAAFPLPLVSCHLSSPNRPKTEAGNGFCP